MLEILDKLDREIKKRENVGFITAYNIEVEKAKAKNKGEITGLNVARQLIVDKQSKPCTWCNSTKQMYDDANYCLICGRGLREEE